MAGTFVFTDTIDASFKDLFERAQQGRRRLRPVAAGGGGGLRGAAADAGLHAGAGPVGRRRRGGRGLRHPATSRCSTARASRSSPTARRRSCSPPGPSASTRSLHRGRPARERRRGRHRQGHGRQVRLGRGRHGDDRRPRSRRRTTRCPASRALGDSDNLAGSRMVGGDAARGAAGDSATTATTTSRSPPRAAPRPRSSRPRSPPSWAASFAVRTGKEQAEKSAQDLSDALGFIRIALLVFAGVAVLVGGFLIFNTFTVTVAQRTREFALLRTLGASRPQILRSVLAETVVIGVIASIVGVAAGLLVAPGAARADGARPASTSARPSTQLQPRTIVVGLLVGVIATVVSGFVPARRATRVAAGGGDARRRDARRRRACGAAGSSRRGARRAARRRGAALRPARRTRPRQRRPPRCSASARC